MNSHNCRVISKGMKYNHNRWAVTSSNSNQYHHQSLKFLSNNHFNSNNKTKHQIFKISSSNPRVKTAAAVAKINQDKLVQSPIHASIIMEYRGVSTLIAVILYMSRCIKAWGFRISRCIKQSKNTKQSTKATLKESKENLNKT